MTAYSRVWIRTREAGGRVPPLRPPAAVAYCKEAAIGGAHLDLASGLRLEKSLFTLLMGTSDRAEAAAAFREKRNPNFTGN